MKLILFNSIFNPVNDWMSQSTGIYVLHCLIWKFSIQFNIIINLKKCKIQNKIK